MNDLLFLAASTAFFFGTPQAAEERSTPPVGVGPTICEHAINTKGTGAAGRPAAERYDHAINTKGTGAAGRVPGLGPAVAVSTKDSAAEQTRCEKVKFKQEFGPTQATKKN